MTTEDVHEARGRAAVLRGQTARLAALLESAWRKKTLDGGDGKQEAGEALALALSLRAEASELVLLLARANRPAYRVPEGAAFTA